MKKLILMFFALVFSVSASFGYRSFIFIETGDSWGYACPENGGNCLPTVEVGDGGVLV